MKLEVSEGRGQEQKWHGLTDVEADSPDICSENSPGWVEQELSDMAGKSGGVTAKAVTSCLLWDLSDKRS